MGRIIVLAAPPLCTTRKPPRRADSRKSFSTRRVVAIQVLRHDLGGAPPVARIVSLVVLGMTFYFGGPLYQKTLGAEG